MNNACNASWYHGYEACRIDSGLDYFKYEILFLQNVSLFWRCRKCVIAKVVRFPKATIIESSSFPQRTSVDNVEHKHFWFVYAQYRHVSHM